ncbi:MAG: acyl-CoA transferase [Frankiales bacterium]|nr:acyl-CoA transferase [Frankiales bacterium]
MTSPAAAYAGRLLGQEPPADASDPVADWAASGAMWLTGRPDGPPLVHTGPAIALRGALLALSALAPGPALPGIGLLGERAALMGLSRQGKVSCGGGSRLLATTTGAVALTLARPEDWSLVPALVESAAQGWDDVAAWASGCTAEQVRDRAVLLGLPCGVVGEVRGQQPWLASPGVDRPQVSRPRVVDLSSLWAGPLAGSLLAMLGCEVLKVEDPRRPDGARRGHPAFFDLLNAGKRSICVDLRTSELPALLEGADVVIEASRPRALRQLGVDAERYVERGTVWLSITGHGRDQDRVGFGDDTAVAGGLVVDGCFVGDAVADPLTGVHGALAAWAALTEGRASLLDVSLAGVAAVAAGLGEQAATSVVAAPPHARPSRGRAPELACS